MGSGPYDIEIDEGLYALYMVDCRACHVKPSIKDYLVWREEQEYDSDEPDWG